MDLISIIRNSVNNILIEHMLNVDKNIEKINEHVLYVKDLDIYIDTMTFVQNIMKKFNGPNIEEELFDKAVFKINKDKE